MEYEIRDCNESHIKEIMEILNEAIINTTALYDYRPFTEENVMLWYTHKKEKKFPLIGIFNNQHILMGFATYGNFRERDAYKYTAEHSIYVRSDKRGKGLGKILLNEIIKQAENQDYHVIIGGIDASNKVSILLHEKAGFVHAGTIKQAGYKFGKWLDLAFYQLILKTPLYPNETIPGSYS